MGGGGGLLFIRPDLAFSPSEWPMCGLENFSELNKPGHYRSFCIFVNGTLCMMLCTC